jgi:L-cysteine:1D-myo-inositol 2-amino-2-deoxy-alpha-D-glucopyranoside ligase
MSESANGTYLVAEIIEDLSNNLDTPSALKRLVDWAQESKKDHNHAGVVSRAIDSLLGLAL